MGYLGFGLQKWIYTMKPRKPFMKRSKKVGYDTIETTENKEFKLKDSVSTNPDILEDSINESKKRINRYFKLDFLNSLFIILSILVLSILAYWTIKNYESDTKRNNKTFKEREIREKNNAIYVLTESGMYHLKNNEIENAIKDFKLALDIDSENLKALKYYIISLSVDCEKNSKNCENALEFYEKLKKIDKNAISEELEGRIVIVQEKLKKVNN